MVDRQSPPRIRPPLALRLPDVHRHVLSNGLETLIVEKPGLPVVDVRVVLRTGARDDPRGLEGMTSFAAEMVDEGTSTRSAFDLADAFDYLGARLSIDASWDATTLALHVLRPRLDAALALLADVLANAAFPDDEIRRKRVELQAALLRDNDEPDVLATKAFNAAVYGESHRYALPLRGTRSSAARLERDALVAFHRDRYRPARGGAFLLVAGAIESADVVAALERTIAAWQGDALRVSQPAGEVPGLAAAIHVVDRPGAPQSEIRVGHAGPPRTTSDYFPLIVLNTMLGGSFTSRLNLRLREEKGYTYGARSVFAFRDGPGPFLAGAAVFTDATADAVADFLGEMRRMREEAVTADELDRARRYLAFGLPRRFETSEQLAAQLEDVVLYGLGDDFYERFAGHVAAVAVEDVRRAARRHLDPAGAQVVIVGDRSRIAPGLEQRGMRPVIDFAYEP